MSKAKNWTYTSLSDKDTLYLEIDGYRYEVSQLTASFARNEIPKATVLVAVGRDARSPSAAMQAQIHQQGVRLSQMLKATVYFEPKEEWDTKGTQWQTRQVIFDGYFVGLAFRKVSGKVQAVMHLVHWLIDLASSSVLSKDTHPSNPTSLVFPSLPAPLQGTGLENEQPSYVSCLVNRDSIISKVREDLWEAIKLLYCGLAQVNKFKLACNGSGMGTGDKGKNSMALNALRRIFGPAGDFSKPYDEDPEHVYAKPLKMQTEGISLVHTAVANAVTSQTLGSAAHSTFWDSLIGYIFPMFQISLIPRITDAMVVADTAAYRVPWTKIIGPDDYSDFDLTGMITRPLQAVGVYGTWESATKIGVTDEVDGSFLENVCIGGHYAVDSRNPGDGVFLVVQSPPWLASTGYSGEHDLGSIMEGSSAMRPDGGVAQEGETPQQAIPKLRVLYNKYARTVYMGNMLQGRGATISGKLRFDIAPGCIVRIEPKPEQFLEGVDEMAASLYARVMRVTININAESSMAGTSFQFTHLRTAAENENERTMVDEHPLFGNEIFTGAPLVNAWLFPEE